LRRAGGWNTISKKRSPGEAPPRIIAATHQDLERLIAAGRFRTDRYYRLKVFTIAPPPLRDRPEDIPLLIHHYLRRLGCELNRRVERVAPEALELLRRHPWPGNVRELEGTLKQALLRSTAPVLRYGNDWRPNGPFALTSDPAALRGTSPALGEGPAETIFLSSTPLPTGRGFAIRRQTRPRFAFAETRPETETPQKTPKKPAL